LAFISDILAVSLLSSPRWDCSCLTLIARQIINDNDEIVEESVKICHASRTAHISKNLDWIKKRTRIQPTDGRELWQKRVEFFPNLIFCESVEKQLQSLSNGNPMLRQVVKRLIELEEACNCWTSGSFDREWIPSKTTLESETRLKQLKQQLTFTCPDGEKRLFSLHKNPVKSET
jgi:hypothetical protein